MPGEVNNIFELESSQYLDNGTGRHQLQTGELSKQYSERQKKLEELNTGFIEKLYKKYEKLIKILLQIVIHILVGAYFGYATHYFIESESKDENSNSTNIFEVKKNSTDRCKGKCGFQWCDGYGMLLIVTVIVYFGMFYYLVFKPRIGKRLYKRFISDKSYKMRIILHRRYYHYTIKQIISSIIVLLIIAGLAVFLYFETQGKEEKLISLIGPLIFIVAGYIFSVDRRSIKWRQVLSGVLCQFILGIICIRWEVGRSIFQCVGDKIVTFLRYSEIGSRFVFGDKIVDEGIFAFAILPVIFFFSFCISILYYLGAMQWLILRLGWILQKILGTTVCESVNAAANIFLGMSETPLLLRPYIKQLTGSELHAIMASGFATVSGTVLAAYVSFGASPALLVTASVMAAPASLAISKLYFPEIEESQTKSDNIRLEKSEDSSILDAASNGASTAIQIILGIIANLVAFVAFIAFLNGVINWFGYLVGLDEITFEWIFSKIFIPLSWIIGVEWKDCDVVARVIASKTIINEFVAYQRLGEYIKANALTARSAGIATFAICGFANPSSLGIMIGTLSALAPERRTRITSVAFRAFVVGSIVCFMSASFAGLLIPDSMVTVTESMAIVTDPTVIVPAVIDPLF